MYKINIALDKFVKFFEKNFAQDWLEIFVIFGVVIGSSYGMHSFSEGAIITGFVSFGCVGTLFGLFRRLVRSEYQTEQNTRIMNAIDFEIKLNLAAIDLNKTGKAQSINASSNNKALFLCFEENLKKSNFKK